MKIKITREKLFDLFLGLQEVRKFNGVKLGLAVAENIELISGKVKIMQELINNYSNEFKDFEQKRIDLCKKYSKIGENGEPKIDLKTKKFIIDETKTIQFQKEYELLENKYKKTFETEKIRQKELAEEFQKEINIELYPILENCLPKDILVDTIIKLKPIIISK